MCSIAIQSELLLGHSPPVYGSLFYSSLMVTTPPIASRSVPPQIRPCLASASLHFDSLLKSSDDVANNNKRNKKKVVFADDRGWPLTQVSVAFFLLRLSDFVGASCWKLLDGIAFPWSLWINQFIIMFLLMLSSWIKLYIQMHNV